MASIKQTGTIRYSQEPGQDPARYIPQSLGVDPSTGKFIYPSSFGQGVEVVSYPLRGNQTSREIQVKEIPHLVCNKLRQAHRQGHLRDELAHHLSVLKENRLVDPGTLELIRQHGGNLTGHIVRDESVLDEITTILNSCEPALEGENL
jgi:hypothetical protein